MFDIFLYQDSRATVTVSILKGSNRVLVFNATFNNISAILWQSALFEEVTGGHEENPRQ